MISVGTDLIEIKRISNSMKNPRFLKRILGENEYLFLEKKGFPAQSVAVNFCAKEAFSKALGTGIRDHLKLREIELLRKGNGMPYFSFKGNALKIVSEQGIKFSISATHTREYASVVVVAWR